VFVGFPILVFLIVIAINKIVQGIHRSRGDDYHTSDPFWVKDHESAELEAASANPGTEAIDQAQAEGTTQAYAHEPEEAALAAETDSTSAGRGDVEGDDTGEHVGGAGARW
jgi:hypothetical protein